MTATVRTVWTAAVLSILLSACATGPNGMPWTLASRPDRGGIEGTVIPLDTLDLKVKGYFAGVKEKIRSNSVFPCVKEAATQACSYKNARVTVEFGILKNGMVQYVEVRQGAGAGLEIYDASAVEAIKRSSPFPALSPEVIAILKDGSTGVPVTSTFQYTISAR